MTLCNCEGCEYSWEKMRVLMGKELQERDGGHCYMFRTKPRSCGLDGREQEYDEEEGDDEDDEVA